MRGRVGALIEVAAGFHPDLTGRENVFLQGAIMGMKRAGDRARASTRSSSSPASRSSSTRRSSATRAGMNARLGFAIAAHLDPDVLLIDEVLARRRRAFPGALRRPDERALRKRGVPLVFVSHNLTAVLELCTRAVLIDRGRLQFDGDAGDGRSRLTGAAPRSPRERASDGRDIQHHRRRGARRVRRGRSRPSRAVAALTVRIHYHASRPVERPHFAVDINRGDGF